MCILKASGGAISIASALGLFAIIAGLVFLAGFLTPIVASILTIGYIVDGILLFFSNDAANHATAFIALYLALMSLALALLGPGAFSVDARLFGRVEIIIPERRPPSR